MKLRLLGLGVLVALASLAKGGPEVSGTNEQAGYLVLPAGPVPYFPQAGDIVLYDDQSRFHHFCYHLAGTDAPTHVAMVVESADHKAVLFDLTGPTYRSAKAIFVEVMPRLTSYGGAIQVRRLHQPLTPEQSAELTAFAHSQEGKCIALTRGILQATPFCCRKGLRRHLFGHTYLSRKRWLCSELVTAGVASVHLIDPDVFLANTIYPRDLAYDETYDLSGVYQPAVEWSPTFPSPVHTDGH
jgi:hypothetical protein